MADRLSSLLGGVLLRLVVGGAVVVAMALFLRGEYLFALGLLIPLAVVVGLIFREAGLLG